LRTVVRVHSWKCSSLVEARLGALKPGKIKRARNGARKDESAVKARPEGKGKRKKGSWHCKDYAAQKNPTCVTWEERKRTRKRREGIEKGGKGAEGEEETEKKTKKGGGADIDRSE